MHGSTKIVWLTIAALVLGTSWAGFAQVPDKPKDKQPPGKKPVPAAPKPGLEATKPAPASGKTPPAQEKETKKPAVAEKPSVKAETEEERPIRESAQAFVQAYNAHDAKAIAELFTLKAEFTDEDGNLIKGREAIQRYFDELFVEFPQCETALEIDSIRLLTPNIAVEEGVVRGKPTPESEETLTGYIAIHVQVDGEWRLGSVSDVAAPPAELTAHDHLQQLAWMVGDWIDESTESTVKSSSRWDESGNYLLHEFKLQFPGGVSAGGSMRIGWDPLSQQLKSWTFDADSGYSEGLWLRIGDEWIVKAHGVNAAGEVTSSTNVFRLIDNDTMSWRSYDRIVGGVAVDDIPENVIKRHAPSPES